MVHYIAQKNTKTGKFELWNQEDKVYEFRDPQKALESYELAVRMHGMDNVLLLVGANVDVKTTASFWEK